MKTLASKALTLAHKIKAQFNTWCEALTKAWEQVKNNGLKYKELITKFGFSSVSGRWEVSGVKMPIVITNGLIQAHFSNIHAFARWTNLQGWTALNPASNKTGLDTYIQKLK